MVSHLFELHDRCGSFTGKRRSSAWSRNVNTAVFAPMPSASESTATDAKTGDLVKERMANRSSPINAIYTPLQAKYVVPGWFVPVLSCAMLHARTQAQHSRPLSLDSLGKFDLCFS